MIAGIIRMVTGAQARWIGIDPTDAEGKPVQRIYFANHGSNLDAPVIWASLQPVVRNKTRPVAARDYWVGSRFRLYLATDVFRCVLIERIKPTARSSPLAAMEEALSAGESLIIFPEGTRTMDDEGEMNEFKPGLWHLARKHPTVELVPVHLENLNRILPKGDFILIPLLVAVTFGQAICAMQGEEKPEFLARAKRAVEQLAQVAGGAG